MKSSELASRSTIIRRLYIDLVGLPPTIPQIQSASDLVDLSTLVDQLLASPQFGVRWGRHWLDLVRYAETLGHEFDYPIRHAWRYRDAVINALNDDVGYDELVSDHLAGDLRDQPRIHPLTGVNESLALTGWWWLGDSVHAPVDIKNDWATRTENQVDVFSKAFLGMTIACARCHDHKFDAIGTKDYFGLVGVARSIRRSYAVTDPHGRIAQQQHALRQLQTDSQPKVLQSWRQLDQSSVNRWLERSIEQWRNLSEAELHQQLPLDSPLFPLRLLVEKTPAGTESNAHFAERYRHYAQQLESAQSEFSHWLLESPLVASFDQGLAHGWKVEQADTHTIVQTDLHSTFSKPMVDWFDLPTPLPSRSWILSSDALGRHQYLTLRSPNFELTHPYLCMKIRGKSTQSSISVDGYFMHEFQGLLFGDLRKPIDQPHDWGWTVHAGDLKKYLGHTAFLSLENDASAWFQISQVRQSSRTPPPEPHSSLSSIWNQSAVSRDAFKTLLVQQLLQALQLTVANASANTAAASSTPESIAAVELARAVLSYHPEWLLEEQYPSLIELTSKVQQQASMLPKPTFLLAAVEGDPTDARIELRGDPHSPGDLVSRGCLQTLVPWQEFERSSASSQPEPSQGQPVGFGQVPEQFRNYHHSGRLELVRSMTDPRHPLVARVIVNRVWHHLFGRGLVSTTDNFGVLGSRPSHPELLDYLAEQFIQHDWSLKWLIRLIVTSRTYQLNSSPLAEQHDNDPDGIWLSHRRIRRLDAEVIRDALLQAAGKLDLQLSGSSVPVHLTGQMTGRGRPERSGPLDGNGRRSAYVEVRRNFLNPFLLAFDFPMPSTTTGQRNCSNVPAQALSLLNDPLVNELCERWVTQPHQPTDARERIEQMILTAFSRSATTAEIDACMEFVDSAEPQAWIDLAHVLVNAKEFSYLQ